MFEDDICRCGNPDLCPRKNECKRAEKPGPGVYTMSYFYQYDGKECKYFWKKVDKNEELSMGN